MSYKYVGNVVYSTVFYILTVNLPAVTQWKGHKENHDLLKNLPKQNVIFCNIAKGLEQYDDNVTLTNYYCDKA